MRNPYTDRPLGPVTRARVSAYRRTLRKARRAKRRNHDVRQVALANKVIGNAEHHIDAILREEAREVKAS